MNAIPEIEIEKVDLSKIDLTRKSRISVFNDKKYCNQVQLVFSDIENYKLKIDRQTYVGELFERLTNGLDDDQKKVVAITNYVSTMMNPTLYTPIYDCGGIIYDPLLLLEIGWGQCGQTNRVLVDILNAGGLEANLLQLNDHVAASVYLHDKWRFLDADALYQTQFLKLASGEIAPLEDLIKIPELTINTPIYMDFDRLVSKHFWHGGISNPKTYFDAKVFVPAELDFGLSPYFIVKKNRRIKNDKFFGWGNFGIKQIELSTE